MAVVVPCPEPDLSDLTELERSQILAVIQRDEEMRLNELSRIEKLQRDIQKLKELTVVDSQCARCQQEFFWFIRRGEPCPQCQCKVCEKCRIPVATLTATARTSSQWLCLLCHKELELQLTSGAWFFNGMRIRRSRRQRRTLSDTGRLEQHDDHSLIAGHSRDESSDTESSEGWLSALGGNKRSKRNSGSATTATTDVAVAFPQGDDEATLNKLLTSSSDGGSQFSTTVVIPPKKPARVHYDNNDDYATTDDGRLCVGWRSRTMNHSLDGEDIAEEDKWEVISTASFGTDGETDKTRLMQNASDDVIEVPQISTDVGCSIPDDTLSQGSSEDVETKNAQEANILDEDDSEDDVDFGRNRFKNNNQDDESDDDDDDDDDDSEDDRYMKGHCGKSTSAAKNVQAREYSDDEDTLSAISECTEPSIDEHVAGVAMILNRVPDYYLDSIPNSDDDEGTEKAVNVIVEQEAATRHVTGAVAGAAEDDDDDLDTIADFNITLINQDEKVSALPVRKRMKAFSSPRKAEVSPSGISKAPFVPSPGGVMASVGATKASAFPSVLKVSGDVQKDTTAPSGTAVSDKGKNIPTPSNVIVVNSHGQTASVSQSSVTTLDTTPSDVTVSNDQIISKSSTRAAVSNKDKKPLASPKIVIVDSNGQIASVLPSSAIASDVGQISSTVSCGSTAADEDQLDSKLPSILMVSDQAQKVSTSSSGATVFNVDKESSKSSIAEKAPSAFHGGVNASDEDQTASKSPHIVAVSSNAQKVSTSPRGVASSNGETASGKETSDVMVSANAQRTSTSPGGEMHTNLASADFVVMPNNAQTASALTDKQTASGEEHKHWTSSGAVVVLDDLQKPIILPNRLVASDKDQTTWKSPSDITVYINSAEVPSTFPSGTTTSGTDIEAPASPKVVVLSKNVKRKAPTVPIAVTPSTNTQSAPNIQTSSRSAVEVIVPISAAEACASPTEVPVASVAHTHDVSFLCSDVTRLPIKVSVSSKDYITSSATPSPPVDDKCSLQIREVKMTEKQSLISYCGVDERQSAAVVVNKLTDKLSYVDNPATDWVDETEKTVAFSTLHDEPPLVVRSHEDLESGKQDHEIPVEDICIAVNNRKDNLCAWPDNIDGNDCIGKLDESVKLTAFGFGLPVESRKAIDSEFSDDSDDHEGNDFYLDMDNHCVSATKQPEILSSKSTDTVEEPIIVQQDRINVKQEAESSFEAKFAALYEETAAAVKSDEIGQQDGDAELLVSGGNRVPSKRNLRTCVRQDTLAELAEEQEWHGKTWDSSNSETGQWHEGTTMRGKLRPPPVTRLDTLSQLACEELENSFDKESLDLLDLDVMVANNEAPSVQVVTDSHSSNLHSEPQHLDESVTCHTVVKNFSVNHDQQQQEDATGIDDEEMVDADLNIEASISHSESTSCKSEIGPEFNSVLDDDTEDDDDDDDDYDDEDITRNPRIQVQSSISVEITDDSVMCNNSVNTCDLTPVVTAALTGQLRSELALSERERDNRMRISSYENLYDSHLLTVYDDDGSSDVDDHLHVASHDKEPVIYSRPSSFRPLAGNSESDDFTLSSHKQEVPLLILENSSRWNTDDDVVLCRATVDNLKMVTCHDENQNIENFAAEHRYAKNSPEVQVSHVSLLVQPLHTDDGKDMGNNDNYDSDRSLGSTSSDCHLPTYDVPIPVTAYCVDETRHTMIEANLQFHQPPFNENNSTEANTGALAWDADSRSEDGVRAARSSPGLSRVYEDDDEPTTTATTTTDPAVHDQTSPPSPSMPAGVFDLDSLLMSLSDDAELQQLMQMPPSSSSPSPPSAAADTVSSDRSSPLPQQDLTTVSHHASPCPSVEVSVGTGQRLSSVSSAAASATADIHDHPSLSGSPMSDRRTSLSSSPMARDHPSVSVSTDRPPLSASPSSDRHRLSSLSSDVQSMPDSPVDTLHLSTTKKPQSSRLSIFTDDNIEEEDLDGAFASYRPSSQNSSEPRRAKTLQPRSSSKSIGSTESIVSSVGGHLSNIVVTGDVCFLVTYNTQYRVLEVLVKACRNLAAVSARRKQSSPYVKVYLLPDKSKTGKRKTKIVRNNLNPVYDQLVQFDVSKTNISTRTVWVSVWHNDRLGRNVFLGDAIVPLDGYTFCSQPEWYKLQQQGKETWKSEISLVHKAELELSLQYRSPESLAQSRGKKKAPAKGELHVTIHRAFNLLSPKDAETTNPYCKIRLLGSKKQSAQRYKTPVIKHDCDPMWNHEVVVPDVTFDELRTGCSLEITVWDHERFATSSLLGGFQLNCGGLDDSVIKEAINAQGEELDLWLKLLEEPGEVAKGRLALRMDVG